VTNVQFLTNATLLGSDSTSPYSIVASNLAPGNCTLTAKATDNTGLSSTSSPVRISVGTTRLVKMGNYSFAPTNLTINSGDTVLWSNAVVTAHDTTSSTGLWASPTFGSPNTYSLNFTNAGYYPYICSVHIVAHPEQTGSVTVVSSGLPPTPVTILNPTMNGTKFTFSFLTQAGRSYNVQFTPTIRPANWQVLTNFTGDGSSALITDINYTAAQRFYRVGAQ